MSKYAHSVVDPRYAYSVLEKFSRNSRYKAVHSRQRSVKGSNGSGILFGSIAEYVYRLPNVSQARLEFELIGPSSQHVAT